MNSKKIVFFLLTMIVATGLITFIVNKYRKPLSTPTTISEKGMPQDPKINCYIKGQEKLNLPDSQLVILCENAKTNSPIDCFLDGKKRLVIGESDLIDLCN